MRTNIDIDDQLLKQAMQATKTTTKKAAVEQALRLAVQLDKQGEALENLWGKSSGEVTTTIGSLPTKKSSPGEGELWKTIPSGPPVS